MEQIPSLDDNSHSVSQEIPRILWKQKVHCCIYMNAAAFSYLSQMNLIYAFLLQGQVITNIEIIGSSDTFSYNFFKVFLFYIIISLADKP
jgi:hypothetical protein